MASVIVAGVFVDESVAVSHGFKELVHCGADRLNPSIVPLALVTEMVCDGIAALSPATREMLGLSSSNFGRGVTTSVTPTVFGSAPTALMRNAPVNVPAESVAGLTVIVSFAGAVPADSVN